MIGMSCKQQQDSCADTRTAPPLVKAPAARAPLWDGKNTVSINGYIRLENTDNPFGVGGWGATDTDSDSHTPT